MNILKQSTLPLSNTSYLNFFVFSITQTSLSLLHTNLGLFSKLWRHSLSHPPKGEDSPSKAATEWESYELVTVASPFRHTVELYPEIDVLSSQQRACTGLDPGKERFQRLPGKGTTLSQHRAQLRHYISLFFLLSRHTCTLLGRIVPVSF